MKKLSETLLRTLVVFIGLVVEGCASVFMIRADVGAGAWTTITQGFSIQTGYTIGQMTTIVGLFTLAADLLLGEKIGIGTLLDTFVYGMTYDVFDRLLVTPENPPFAYGYILLILGIVTEIIGLAICLHTSSIASSQCASWFRIVVARMIVASGYFLRILRTNMS